MIYDILTFALYVGVAILSAGGLYAADRLSVQSKSRLSSAIKFSTIGASLMLPSLLAAFRLNVGTDYRAYVFLVDDIARLNITEYITQGYRGLEPLFYVFSWLSEFLTDGPRVYFFLMALVTVSALYLALIKLKVQRTYLVYFALLLIVFLISFNNVRQMAAVAVTFYAIAGLLVNRSNLKYITTIVLASLFHVSALLLLPLVFITKYIKAKDNLRQVTLKTLPLVGVCIAFILSFVIFGDDISFLKKFVENSSAELGGGGNKLFYLQLLLVLGATVLFKPISRVNKYTPYLLTLSVVGVLFVAVGFWSEYLKRYYLYFTPYILLLMSSYIDSIEKGTKKKSALAIYVLYVLAFSFLFYILLGHGDIAPYSYSIKDGIIR